MADAHAEIADIQKAYEDGNTQDRDMETKVLGEDVCGYCKGDIPAAAHKLG
jgi:filamentous hemagglutinin